MSENKENDDEETKTKKSDKKERKIYKGRVVTAKALMEELKDVVPVQPMKRSPPGAPDWLKLPPTFLLTKFTPGYSGAVVIHYYDPKKKAKGKMEVPSGFELNLLEGTRGLELNADFEQVKKTALQTFVHRINCTIGTDPEIFAVDKDGHCLPAWTFLGGKDAPVPYDYSGFKGNCYWDGFQAEFTVPAPLTCLENMGAAIRGGLMKIHQRAGKKGGRLSHKSVLEIPPAVLNSCKPEHVQFGCSPSKNIYGLKGNIQDGRDVKYRFAGGHIHMGLNDEATGKVYGEDRIRTIVRGLDTVLGVACVSLYASYDNPVRRQYYGQPGEYRTPPHGLEYRPLSNAWLMHPLIYNLTFDLARAVAGLTDEGFLSAWNASEDETVETIMNHDVERARDILRRNDALFRSVIQMGGGGYAAQPDVAKRVFNEGLESAIKSPEDIVGNWALESEDNWYRATRSYYQAWSKLGSGAKV